MTNDPTVVWARDNYINHPDHRAAGTAAIDAIFPAAGQPHLFQELAEEGLRAHKVRKVYITSFGQGDTFVNISETMELKLAALHKHASQFPKWDPSPRVLEWSALMAKGKEMAYAEAFKVITLVSDEDFAQMTADAPTVARTTADTPASPNLSVGTQAARTTEAEG